MTLNTAETRLVEGRNAEPHAVLGAHPAGDGIAVRAFHPDATGVECLPDVGRPVRLEPRGRGLFEARLAATSPFPYSLRFHFADGAVWERGDPYRFPPTLGDLDLHLFNEGRHRRLWARFGAHPMRHEGVEGTAFAVWAPNAVRVSLVGDFCRWDGRALPMRQMGSSGVFELFVPGLGPGDLYKFEILTREGQLRLKTDPLAFAMEPAPGSASRIVSTASYAWGDGEWTSAKREHDPRRRPMAIYEVHLGSWRRAEGNRWLGYRELAPLLVEHVTRLGFTHVELLPVAEHPFDGSWGYQVTGYFAPTSRFGAPDDFRFLVDSLHRAGIGVILDWVPAHFPKDDFALRRFDGTALYEHEDPRQGEHPDWGTLIFNFGRPEVRNFLVANALYWLVEFHVDGLRVDAVASMLYLDYSRQAGEWLPNRSGGRENLDAIDFLREVNHVVATEHPGCFTVAEESTAWPSVTGSPQEGGLGFTFKWNMGWMHDTLTYFSKDPLYRTHHHDQLTFAMMYEHSERFVMPLSHDEVVHMKGSLFRKMPGDPWQKLANLRTLFAYQYTRPGKKLLFMGSELAPEGEWSHDRSLDWNLATDPSRAGLQTFLGDLGALYASSPAFWRSDPDPEGFSWIDCSDRQNSVISYVRRGGGETRLVVLNLTPVPHDSYRIGTPGSGRWRLLLSSDEMRYGGSGFSVHDVVETEPVPFHDRDESLVLRLPPLAALVLAPT